MHGWALSYCRSGWCLVRSICLVSVEGSEDSPLSVYILQLEVEQDWIVSGPSEVEIEPNNCTFINVDGNAPGQTIIKFSCFNSTSNLTCPFTKENFHLAQTLVSVVRSLPLNYVIIVVGWIYAVAGIFSFFPQIIHNFRRRCVEGLSFDFVGLNFTGGLAYAVFNIGLYAIPQVEDEYFHRHPGGVKPVLLNDVVFSVNAAFLQATVILQCIVLKHGQQKLSYSGIVLIGLLWLVMFIMLFLSIGQVINWLDYLYIISYIKLSVTPIKYIPQIWVNFRTRSTVGFSTWYVILEVLSGSFSVLQMFLLSYNYNDWKSIFGDPTKFGFGALTVFFDFILILQRVVYRRRVNEGDDKMMKEKDLEIKLESRGTCTSEEEKDGGSRAV